MTIRTASDADAPAIRSLLETAGLPTESLGRATTEFYLAEDSGKAVAVAGLEFYGEDALLRSVTVRDDLRKSGIGSALVERMISVARERNVARILLLTQTARAFFERKGFTFVERDRLTNEYLTRSSEFANICPSSATAMMLSLTNDHRR